MNECAFQIQRMLADELDHYKEKGNRYIKEDIQEIQDLYIYHLNKILFQALINSGSTLCFVDSKFVDTHHLKTSVIPLVTLYLFNGSLNNISEIANLPIIFSTSYYMNLNFNTTLIDSSYSLVLGYNWLI